MFDAIIRQIKGELSSYISGLNFIPVVDILCQYFQKSEPEATRIMLAVHHEGRGLCGIYPFEIAESKMHLVRQTSRKHGHPLKCMMEKVENGDKPC